MMSKSDVRSSSKEDLERSWRPVRKRPVVVEARPATAEDEVYIRNGEESVIEKFGLRAYADLWPHYMILRGSRGEIWPVEKSAFAESYEEVEDASSVVPG